jgi:hypothetical protein
MNSLKDYGSQRKTKALHYPYVYTTLTMNKTPPYINSTVSHHLIINSHSNPNSHNLTKPQPNHAKFILQNYILNIIEN